MTTSVTSNTHAAAIPGRAWVLAVLTLTYTFNHIDRQVLVILLEPIKAELHLKDGDLGMLTGIVFAGFYATLGIPVAMWADRGNRRNIITLALTLWSAMTAMSGLAQTYWQLLLARMGVGVGEAGGTPPATSMIADLYPPRERATAMGIYTTGIGLGVMAGFALGGYIYAHFGWRTAFFVAGVPGLLLALLVRFTVKEPVRGLADQQQVKTKAPSFSETVSFILGQTSYLWLLAGCLLICISANAFLVFTSGHLQRTYGLTPSQVSLPLGVLIGGVGSIGAVTLGAVCDRLSRKDMRWRPLMIALCAAIALPFAWMFLHAETVWSAYAWNLVPSFIGLIYASIAYTASQELVQVQMRSFASAFMLFCLTLIGIGCGPWIAGELSDYFLSNGATNSLARALEIMLLFNLGSIVCLLMATRNYRRDAERAAKAA
jgi:predicted MFS family arabinose efflux permease